MFRRKNQIDLSVEKNKDLPLDDEFQNLNIINTSRKDKKFINRVVKKNIQDGKEELKNKINNSNTYLKNNSFPILKGFFILFAIVMLTWSFFNAFLPFSYSMLSNNQISGLSNFYYFNGSSIALTINGFTFVIFFLLFIATLITTKVLLIKNKKQQVDDEKLHKNLKVQKSMKIMKILFHVFITISFIILLLIFLYPSNIQSSFNNINDTNFIYGILHRGPLTITSLSLEDANRFLQILNMSTLPDHAAAIAAVNNNLTNGSTFISSALPGSIFYNNNLGGLSSLTVGGLSVFGLSVGFTSLGLALYIVVSIMKIFNSKRIEKLKNINLNINTSEFKEGIVTGANKVGTKAKGFYKNSINKYNNFKEKDNFKKYKQRLVEEGKDTNENKFTTDIVDETIIQEEKVPSMFSLLKDSYKKRKESISSKVASNSKDKQKSKSKKTEIAIPDDELDEIIKSLDLK